MKTLLICGLILFSGTTAFLFNVDFPNTPVAEEVHYVKAARMIAETGTDPNAEHPPLAKQLIAVGISIFGDSPLGWRAMSAVFGALTLVGMYLWGLALLRRRESAAWAVFFSAMNPFLWTEAHLATLDIFQFAFTTWGCAAFFESWLGHPRPRRRFQLLAFAGVMFGLSTACKWFGVVPWLACAAIGVMLTRKKESGFTRKTVFWGLGLIPLLSYILPFSLYISHQGFVRWLGLHHAIWLDQTQLVTMPDVKALSWYLWPFQLMPRLISLQMEPKPSELWVRSILLIANPVVIWGGIAATVTSIVLALRSKEKKGSMDEGLRLGGIFTVFYLSWALIPHGYKYYYYFYPAAMSLSLAMSWGVGQLRKYRWIVAGMTGAVFLYFFPVVSGMKVVLPWFRLWTWIYQGFQLPIPG